MKKDISMAALIQWVYGAQKAHTVIDQGRGLLPDERRADGRAVREVSGCGVARCMDNGVLGVEIDYYGPDMGSLHVDADEVHSMVRMAQDIRMFDYIQVGQIIHYGQTGIVPDWMPGAVPSIRPVVGRKGRVKMLYADPKRQRGAYACEVEIVLTPQQIEMARDVYAKFVDAMEKLKLFYQDNPLKLNSFQVVELGLERVPWEKNVDLGVSIS